MSERMKRKKEERRNEIIDIAEKIIAKKGIHGMTMNEVAKKADVAIGTLYVYFENKNSLSAAVIARIVKQINALMEKNIASCTDISKGITSIWAAVIEFKEKNPGKWNVFKELRSINFQDASNKNISLGCSNHGCNDQYDFQDSLDENIKELLLEDRKMTYLGVKTLKQGIDGGIIRSDIDPVATAIFMRNALFIVLEPFSYTQQMLKVEDITPEYFLEVMKDLMRHAVRA